MDSLAFLVALTVSVVFIAIGICAPALIDSANREEPED